MLNLIWLGAIKSWFLWMPMLAILTTLAVLEVKWSKGGKR